MSAHAVVFEVWLHVETDCSGFLPILSREFARYYHNLLCGYFLDHLRGVFIEDRRKQNGGKMSTAYKRRGAPAEPGGRL